MTQEQETKLENALNALYACKEYNELRAYVKELANTGLNNPSIERAIDEVLICRGAYMYDTINGEPTHGKTLVQKIRKVLGYTYP